ncbi:MAG: hypothetical protein Kow00105_05800 [Phycisphaeraceae bacterium]
MTFIIPVQCHTCKHYKASTFCEAFPKDPGIPRVILENQFDHRQPYEGDHGVRWEPNKPGLKHPFDWKQRWVEEYE